MGAATSAGSATRSKGVGSVNGIFMRDAKKLLKRLSNKNAFLKKKEASFELWHKQSKKPLEVVGENLGKKLFAAALLKKNQDDHLVLSDAGLHFLRRQVLAENHLPDAFRRQHFLTEQHRTYKNEPYEVNIQENPLFWLSARRGRDGKPIISLLDLAAGERLQEDFFNSTAKAKMTIDLSQPYIGKQARGFDGAPMSDRAMAARSRMQAALKTLGPGLADIALEVCCYQQGLEKAERHLGWPKRTGKIVLQIALQRLARFYRLG